MQASAANATVAIIGGGPAGLMAAEVLAEAGITVDLFDAMPSVGRKFLLAGLGGLNLTHAEPLETFLTRYGARRDALAPLIEAFPPDALRSWAKTLGIETFVGSSQRIFPTEMKAAPLLRAWLSRLRRQGVRFHVRHRWQGWTTDGKALRFATPDGEHHVDATATVLALGGGSWPKLGSDGAWIPYLQARGIDVAPLQPANCGFDVDWSAHFKTHFSGQPVKRVAVMCSGASSTPHRRMGEFTITDTGVEGSLIYAQSAILRETIRKEGQAVLTLDLLPDLTIDQVMDGVSHPRGSRSLSSHLQSRLGLKGVKTGLLRECVDAAAFNDPLRLAQTIKALPLTLLRPRPLAEAISSAGGVTFEALDENLMLRDLPGVFCTGEMLDWEAPTGGYLLTACFASGRAAGKSAQRYLAQP